MEIELLNPLTADLDELVRLQRLAFDGVVGTSAMDSVLQNVLTVQNYQRKYVTPAGNALLVVIREGGEALAMNAMIPTVLTHSGGSSIAWQSCDTATHPKARGRGMFGTCVKALAGQLREGDVFMGFPNKNSTPGFLKSGWSKSSELDVYAQVLPAFGRDASVARVEQFDARQDALAHKLLAPGTVMFERSSSYLNWRYFGAAESKYTAFVYGDGSGLEGFTVVRSVSGRAKQFGMIMELFGTSTHVRNALVAELSHWAWRQGSWPLVSLANCWGTSMVVHRSFLKMPRRLSPRPLVLMGVGIGEAGRMVYELNWQSMVGDWDVF